MQIAYASSDELSVLRAEIENGYHLVCMARLCILACVLMSIELSSRSSHRELLGIGKQYNYS